MTEKELDKIRDEVVSSATKQVENAYRSAFIDGALDMYNKVKEALTKGKGK